MSPSNNASDAGSPETPPSAEELIRRLGAAKTLDRIEARQALVRMGNAATPALIAALSDTDEIVRWEAAKALGDIADPAAIEALINALEDEIDVRWLAGEALIRQGRSCLVPLLRALCSHSPSLELLQGAHHVLHDMWAGSMQSVVQSVLEALKGSDPQLSVPVAASEALRSLGF